MILKHILFGVSIIAVVCQTGAQETLSLTDDEVHARKQAKYGVFSQPLYNGKFYSRKFAAIPGDNLRAELTRDKSLNWAFCEALTNTVVRILTRGLRQINGNALEDKTVIWQANRKSFTFKYKAVIENGDIISEECLLKFAGMPALRTLNGKMPGCPDISRRQLNRILHYLKESDIEVSKVNIGLKKDINGAKSLLDYLNLENGSEVYTCMADEVSPQIRIVLK